LHNAQPGTKQGVDEERLQSAPRNQRKKWSRPGEEEQSSVPESAGAAEGLEHILLEVEDQN